MARPRSEDYGDKRQRILEEAAHLFARHGFSATSIAMLAAACEASKALIYHYYRDKNEILFDMLDHHVRHLNEAAQGVLANGEDDIAKLRSLVRLLMGIYVKSRDKHVVLMNEISSLNPEQQALLTETQSRLVHEIADLVARLHGVDALKGPKARTALGMTLLGTLNWTYTWFREDGPIKPEQFADIACEIFLSGVQSARLAELAAGVATRRPRRTKAAG